MRKRVLKRGPNTLEYGADLYNTGEMCKPAVKRTTYILKIVPE